MYCCAHKTATLTPIQHTVQGLAQVTPLPSERVRICGDPQIHEFPLHHYGGLGTRTRENL